MTTTGKHRLSDAQRVLLECHEDGEFAHLLEAASEAAFDEAVRRCGDGLLRHLVAELSEAEDCEDLDVAVRRVEAAIDHLQRLRAALQARQP